MNHLDLDLVVAQALKRLLDGLDGALHVGLDDDVQLLDLPLRNLVEQIVQRGLALRLDQRGARLVAALLGDLAAQAVVVHGGENVARLGHVVKADYLHRVGRARFLHAFALVVYHGADTAIGHAGDDGIAHAQRAVLDQHVGDGAAALVQTRLDDDAARLAVRVRLVVLHLSDQQNHFQQLIDALAGLRGNGHDDRVAAPCFVHQLVLGQLLTDAVGIGGRLIHLVDGDDRLHAGGLRVVDGLNGLRHNAVVRRDDQNGDIRCLRAAGTHGGERLVAGGVEEGDALAVKLHGIRADVLRDAAGLAGGHVALADIIEQ